MYIIDAFVYIHLSFLIIFFIISKKVYIAMYPLPLVYGLYAWENVDSC